MALHPGALRLLLFRTQVFPQEFRSNPCRVVWMVNVVANHAVGISHDDPLRIQSIYRSLQVSVSLFLFFHCNCTSNNHWRRGPSEIVFLLGAKFLHLDTELSIALSLMFYSLSAVVSLGGIYWLFFPPFRRETTPAGKSKFTDSAQKFNLSVSNASETETLSEEI